MNPTAYTPIPPRHTTTLALYLATTSYVPLLALGVRASDVTGSF